MDQGSGRPVTADRRPRWRALRPVLVLGGFVAVWWALMTGVAQADSTPHHLVDHVRSQVKAVQTETHAQPIQAAVRRVHSDAKATTAAVRHQVRQAIQPVTTKATKTVRTTLSETITTTRGVVEKTGSDAGAGPVVSTVENAVKSTTEKPESSPGQGNSPKLGHSPKASVTSLAGRPSNLPAASPENTATPDRRAASTSGDTPVDVPAPSLLPDPCSSPSGSGSASSTPVGITESSLLVMPTVQRDLRSWRLARLPGGPAYQPGSSPD